MTSNIIHKYVPKIFNFEVQLSVSKTHVGYRIHRPELIWLKTGPVYQSKFKLGFEHRPIYELEPKLG